jgi:hypothetical protein
MWYKKNLRIAQDNSVKVNTNLKSSKTIPLYKKNKTNPAFKNFGKLNLNTDYLGNLSNGEVTLLFNNKNNIEKFNNMAYDVFKNYYILLQIDFDANKPFFQVFKINEHNLDVPNDFIFDFFDSNKNTLKFSFPTDGNGDFIPSFTYRISISKKARTPSERSLEQNFNLNNVEISEPSIFKNKKELTLSPGKIATFDSTIDPAEEKENVGLPLNTGIGVSQNIQPISITHRPTTDLTAPTRPKSGIGISMLGLDNISVRPQEPRLRQPILPESKIITGLDLDPVKYPKYNFPINVESLAKSTYNFKAPVEIYIDGVLKIKGHPNQSLYPLYSENMPLSEGIHILQAKDPKFNTTNTKIMNTQTFTFEVKENQPIKIIKEDPRPGSF